MSDKTKKRVTMQPYVRCLAAIIISLIIINFIIIIIDRASGIALIIFNIPLIFSMVILYKSFQKRMLKAIVDYSQNSDYSMIGLFEGVEMPCSIISENGDFVWSNESFLNLFSNNKKARTIYNVFPDFNINKNGADDITEKFYKRDDKVYRIKSGKINIGNEQAYALYIYDNTEIEALKNKLSSEKAVVGLIYIDSYDEAMDSIEDVRRSMLEALIDRKINRYINAIDGIVKKVENDKYLCVIKNKYLSKLETDRFDILEEVKGVNIGNEMSVTLSIGIGCGSDSYIQNYEYARMAIDMALGRGGDQAVVKDKENITYFGGKSKGVEKSTKVKARVKAHALRELINTKDKVLIMGHKNMDIDVFGSSIGMWRIATSFGKRAHIVTGNINSSLKPIEERFKDGKYPEDMFINSEKAKSMVDDNTMLVVVDVNRPSITECPELLKLVKTVVVLDHHRLSSEVIENASLSYVETYASSACEMVAEIIQYISEDIKIRPMEADALYSGIVIDTLNFTNQTGVRTFEAAAFLRRKGADTIRVRKLFRDNLSAYKIKAKVIDSAEIFEDNFAISECIADEKESPTVLGAKAANELLGIVGVKASVVITPYNGVLYLSARSIDDVNVQVMMEKLGGGGHRTVAGAQLKGVDIAEAKMMIKNVIIQMIKDKDI